MELVRQILLVSAAVSAVAVGLLHVAMLVVGDVARNLEFFRAGPTLARLAREGSPIPYVITALAAVVFTGFAAPALAVAGVVPAFPFAREAGLVIGCIFTLRGAALPVQFTRFVSEREPRDRVFSAVSLGIGALYLGGLLL